MPYVSQEARERAWERFHKHGTILNEGDLAYLISQLIDRYVCDKGLRYATINDVVGTLETVKHDFQRRFQDPYEGIKLEQNGDVYADLQWLLDQAREG